MLERVIGAMRTDQVKALQLINEGAAGFRELDLYPYCGNDEGVFTAHPELVGTSMRDLRDKRGNPLGRVAVRDREGGRDRPSHLLLAAARVDRHPPEDRSRHPHRRPGLRGRLLSAGPSRQGGTALGAPQQIAQQRHISDANGAGVPVPLEPTWDVGSRARPARACRLSRARFSVPFGALRAGSDRSRCWNRRPVRSPSSGRSTPRAPWPVDSGRGSRAVGSS